MALPESIGYSASSIAYQTYRSAPRSTAAGATCTNCLCHDAALNAQGRGTYLMQGPSQKLGGLDWLWGQQQGQPDPGKPEGWQRAEQMVLRYGLQVKIPVVEHHVNKLIQFAKLHVLIWMYATIRQESLYKTMFSSL